MLYNVDFELASGIFLLISAIFMYVQFGHVNSENKRYFVLVFIAAVTNFLDVITAVTISYSSIVPVWLNCLLNVTYLVSASLLTGGFLKYFWDIIHPDGKKTPYYIINFVIIFLYEALVISSPFTGLLFKFTKAEGYTHGPLYILVYIVPFLFIIEVIIFLLVNIKKFEAKRILPIAFYMLLAFLGPALQMFFFPDVLLATFSVSIGVILVGNNLVSVDVQQLNDLNKELSKAREEAENAKEEAYAAVSSKDKYLAKMSHEIRTPINSVLGMNEMIQREAKDENILAYAADIETGGKMLLSLVNDILDLSKIEADKMEIIPVEYQVRNLIRDCYVIINSRAREKNLDLYFDIDVNLPDTLYGDDIRIRQIIINLLTNAVKYTDKGQVTLCMSGEESEGSFILKIAVKDTGHGIRKEDQEKIFENFQRIDEKKNRNVEGIGLGLLITKQLTDLMHGKLVVESVYELGSCFSVDIPQIVVNETPLGEFSVLNPVDVKKKAEHKALIYAPRAKVLFVDDMKTNLKVMTALLKETGVNVDTALSGSECIKKVRDTQYDMIFLDHMMPEMDGIETMYELLHMEDNKSKETPVIMLTANASQGAKEEYMQEGFSDYLSKPCKGKELEEMLLKYLPDDIIDRKHLNLEAEG